LGVGVVGGVEVGVEVGVGVVVVVMFHFGEHPSVYQNLLGEMIVVTGFHLRQSFTQFLSGYHGEEWFYVCEL